MNISYVHLLVDNDGTATPVQKPIGIGTEKYITNKGEYKKAATTDGVSDIVMLCDDHDHTISLTIFLQEK